MITYAFISKICALVQKYAFMFEKCIYIRFGNCSSRGAVSFRAIQGQRVLAIKNIQICVNMRNIRHDKYCAAMLCAISKIAATTRNISIHSCVDEIFLFSKKKFIKNLNHFS